MVKELHLTTKINHKQKLVNNNHNNQYKDEKSIQINQNVSIHIYSVNN